MSTCPSCSVPVTPGMEDCENCGCPLTHGEAQKRRTEFGELYRPEKTSKRKTQIDASPSPFPPAQHATPDFAADPFAAAVTRDEAGSGGRKAKRRTAIDGLSAGGSSSAAPLDPDDPFAGAVTLDPLPSARQELSPDRPLAGLLITFSGAACGRVFALTRGRTMVGRDSTSDPGASIHVDDDTVSDQHCVLVARESVVMVQDQMSSNGTKLRSEGDPDFRDILAEATLLKHGDLLRLGDVTFLVHLLDPAQVKEIWA